MTTGRSGMNRGKKLATTAYHSHFSSSMNDVHLENGKMFCWCDKRDNIVFQTRFVSYSYVCFFVFFFIFVVFLDSRFSNVWNVCGFAIHLNWNFISAQKFKYRSKCSFFVLFCLNEDGDDKKDLCEQHFFIFSVAVEPFWHKNSHHLNWMQRDKMYWDIFFSCLFEIYLSLQVYKILCTTSK